MMPPIPVTPQPSSAHLPELRIRGAHLSKVLLGVGHKAMGVKLFLVGRIFLARREYFWLGGTLATFGAVFSRAPQAKIGENDQNAREENAFLCRYASGFATTS